MKTDLVSVIMPTYNTGSILTESIDSILNQTYKNLELIITDDKSDDETTLAILRSYMLKDKRVKVFFLDENKGTGYARNNSIKNAQGQYIAFCDSDDTVRDFWLSSMTAESAKAGMVVCGYNLIRQSDGSREEVTLGHTEIFTDDDVLLETLISRRLLQFVWNKLFSMSVIRDAGLRFDESFKVFEDEHFVLGYVMCIRKVICIPSCAYDYRLPADFMKKYDFGIESFQAVVERIYAITGDRGGIRLPSVVYWYKVALGRYAASHSYVEALPYLKFARRLAMSFRDGPVSHLSVRILPYRVLYRLLRLRNR